MTESDDSTLARVTPQLILDYVKAAVEQRSVDQVLGDIVGKNPSPEPRRVEPPAQSEHSGWGGSRLSEVPWADLEHAYGDGEQIPALLETLAVSRDPDASLQACSRLGEYLTHQGSVFVATAPALPFLIEALGTCLSQTRGALIGVLSEIADGLHTNYEELKSSEDERFDDHVDTCIRSVWEGFDVYVNLLEDEADKVRVEAPYLLATLLSHLDRHRPERLKPRDLDGEVSERLLARVGEEQNPFVRCSVAFCLGALAPRHASNVDALLKRLREAEDVREKICTAMSLVDLGEDSGAIRVLSEAFDRREQTDPRFQGELPWLVGRLHLELARRPRRAADERARRG